MFGCAGGNDSGDASNAGKINAKLAARSYRGATARSISSDRVAIALAIPRQRIIETIPATESSAGPTRAARAPFAADSVIGLVDESLLGSGALLLVTAVHPVTAG